MAVFPQNQAFAEVPLLTAGLLPVHISGGHARLIRYAVAAEKEDGNLGEYDPSVDQDYDWPELPDGASVDLGYSGLAVNVDDALLRYFQDLVSQASVVQPVSGRPNRVRSDSVNFKENGDDFPRDALLLDRDVAVGDAAYVRGTVASITYDLWSTVRDFAGEPVAAVVGAATADDNNQDTQVLSSNVTKTAGADNCVTISADPSGYDGLEAGDATETYTILVTAGSVGGDFTTATLRVTSASGHDDDDDVTPSAAAAPTAIGARGLEVTFDTAGTSESCSSAAALEEVSPFDLIAGQTYVVQVNQPFTAPTATAGGSYSGQADAVILITVTKGGLYADSPEITVTTDDGADVSGPTVVPDPATAVAAGTKGVTVSFDQTALRAGDAYRIAVTAATVSTYQTLVLADNLPDGLLAATDLDLKLYIKKDLLLTANRVGSPPDKNWSAAAGRLTLHAGATAYDSSWADGDEQLPLPLEGGTVYLSARYWRTDLCDQVTVAVTRASAAEALGTVHPDNPLAYGVDLAMQNCLEGTVAFTAVSDPEDDDAWARVLEVIDGRDDVYGLVPLTAAPSVQALFYDHVTDPDKPDLGLQRCAWFGARDLDLMALASGDTTEDGSVVLASLADDPDASGTQYTRMSVTSANADLLALGVRAGDTARYLFTTDGFGGPTWTEFLVLEVVSSQTVILATAHSSAVSTPQKVEFWRTMSADDVEAELVRRSAAWDSTRVCQVFPDVLEDADGRVLDGFFIGCALAGMRSLISPHQSLLNLELKGLGAVSRCTDFLRAGRLRALVAQGVTVISRTLDGQEFVLKAVTTAGAGSTDVNVVEEVVRNNLDNLARFLRERLGPTLSSYNTNDDAFRQLSTDAAGSLAEIDSRTRTIRLGAQLEGGQVTQAGRHSFLPDHAVLQITGTINYPGNVTSITVVV